MIKIKFRIFDKIAGVYIDDNWKINLLGGVSIEEAWATKDVRIEMSIDDGHWIKVIFSKKGD